MAVNRVIAVLVIGLMGSTASCGGDSPADSGDGPADLPDGPATIAVVTSSDGSPDDPDGYAVTFDGGEPRALGIDDSLEFGPVAVGNHELALAGLARDCRPYGINPRSASAVAGQRLRVVFLVHCVPPPAPPTLVFDAPGLPPLVGPRDTVNLVLDVVPNSLDPLTGITFTFSAPGPADTLRLPVTGTSPLTIVVTLVVPVLPLVGTVTATATISTARDTYAKQVDFTLGDVDPPHYANPPRDTMSFAPVAIDGPGVQLPYTAASRSGLTSVDISTTGAFTLDTMFPVDGAPAVATRDLTIVMPPNSQVGDTFDIFVGGTNIYGHSGRALYVRYRMVMDGDFALPESQAEAYRTGSSTPAAAPGSSRWAVSVEGRPDRITRSGRP
jgi:hypothetical protein